MVVTFEYKPYLEPCYVINVKILCIVQLLLYIKNSINLNIKGQSEKRWHLFEIQRIAIQEIVIQAETEVVIRLGVASMGYLWERKGKQLGK